MSYLAEDQGIVELAREKIRFMDEEKIRVRKLNDGGHLVKFIVRVEDLNKKRLMASKTDEANVNTTI